MNLYSRQPFTLKPLLAILLLTTAKVSSAANGITPLDAGSILQELKPSTQQQPLPTQPKLHIESKDTSKLPPSVPFHVNRIQLIGNTEFATHTLHALVASHEGQELTLEQLNEVAAQITRHYQQHGFPLSRAIIPVQTIDNGVVSIQVIEARHGKVQLNNGSRLSNALLESTIAPLQSKHAIQSSTLDRTLLLLSDIPEVQVSATLKPGTEVGSSDMEINTTHNPSSTAKLSLDNYGNRYIGRTRVNGSWNLINPLQHGDILNVQVLSTGNNLNYGRLSYDTLLNGQGTRAGAAYSNVHYKLGNNISALNANGTADVNSIWVKHPFIRNKQSNLYGQLQYDGKQLNDHIDTSNTKTDRHLSNWVLSLNGDVRDNLLTGGINVWSLGLTSGQVDFDDTDAQASDATSAQTQGNFFKWNLNYSRLQGINKQAALYINFAYQGANGNLDSAEKMSVGGPYTVRAYDIGAVSADSGYQGSIEYRHDISLAVGGQLQALAFIDSAHVQINRTPWSTSDNKATLSGVGVGVNWNGPDLWKASLYLASKYGNTPTQVTDSANSHTWLVLSKAF